MTSTAPKTSDEAIIRKDVSDLIDVLTSNIMFPNKPFTYQDIEPDLIIKWQVPDAKKQRYINKVDYENISAFLSTLSPQLERAFELCQKRIMTEMQQNLQNEGTTQVKFRYMQSISQLKKPLKHHNTIIMERDIQNIEMICYDEKINRLDGFTLYYNAISYILQTKCGFRVRTFMINARQEESDGVLGFIDQLGIDVVPDREVRYLYIFLSLSLENMMRVATRYSIKKQIDYSIFDFHLNDPTASDQRPMRFHSQLRDDKQFRDEMQVIERFFKIRESIDITADIIDEGSISFYEYQKFLSFWEASLNVFKFLKNIVLLKASPQEKAYIYMHNRQKINPGCQKLYVRLTQKDLYFELQKYLCAEHGYNVNDEPPFYEEFSKPQKQIKEGFFAKLRSILKYHNQNINPYGDLTLFNSMERTKLCYLMLKSVFKMNHLKGKLNLDVIALNNNFEKFGEGGQNQRVRGGMGGTYLKARWYIYGLFSDVTLLRNYFGDVIAHQLMIKILVLTYLFSLCIPFILLYIFERVYSDQIYLYSTGIQTTIFTISFSIFAYALEEKQRLFVQDFSDKKASILFRNQFRGPYQRNILTDEVNQFKNHMGFLVFLRNLACFLIFAVVVVCIGAVFYGCRIFLVDIYDGLYHLSTQIVSIPHICSYSIYLIMSMIFQNKLYGRIVQFLIFIKNPSTEAIERDLKSFFTFYYLLAIEIIPIFFFFIIEPFSRTSCYSVSCDMEFQRYIYAHFLLSSAVITFQLIKVIVFGRGRQKILKLAQQKTNQQALSYQDKLKKLIVQSIKEGEKQHYEGGLTEDIISLFTLSFYCSEVPVAALIAFAFVAFSYTTTRLTLLYDTRRPINKSEPIIKFSQYCNSIFFCGVLINVWINTFLLNFIQMHYTIVISWAPHPLTSSSILLLKLLVTVIYVSILYIISRLTITLLSSLSPKALIKRQHEKYRQYEKLVRGPKKTSSKQEELKPIRSIFRTFNPQTMNHDKLAQKLDEIDYYKELQRVQNGLLEEMMFVNMKKGGQDNVPKQPKEDNQSGVRLIVRQM